MLERRQCLKNCSLFDRLSDDEISRLEQQCWLKSAPRGSLFDLGNSCDPVLGLVITGRIKISHITEHGRESILSFIYRGEIFGELAVVEESGPEVRQEAVDDSEVLLIPVATVRHLMECHNHVSLAITKLIGLRRKRVECRLVSHMFHSTRERLIQLLFDLAEDHGVMRNGEQHLQIRLSHQEVANLLGSTRETVTVLLGELKRDGLIRLNHRRIVFTQRIQRLQLQQKNEELCSMRSA